MPRAQARLSIPSSSAVPLGELPVCNGNLLLMVSSEEDAAKGMGDSIYVIDSETLKITNTIPMTPSATHLAVSPDCSKMYGSSLNQGSITTYDSASGRQITRIPAAAETLAWFVLAPSA
jgi:DNA-binding beta-propeller fold protein YncE